MYFFSQLEPSIHHLDYVFDVRAIPVVSFSTVTKGLKLQRNEIRSSNMPYGESRFQSQLHGMLDRRNGPAIDIGIGARSNRHYVYRAIIDNPPADRCAFVRAVPKSSLS